MTLNVTQRVVRNSPVEFVITGPSGGRDRVLIRSEEAKLDLIAAALQPPEMERLSFPVPVSELFFAAFFAPERRRFVLSSRPIADLEGKDTRTSVARFAWRGQSDSISSAKISEILDYRLVDIFGLLARGDSDSNGPELEEILSPLLFACVEVEETYVRRRRRMSSVFVIYMFIAVFIFIGLVLREYLLGR